MIGRGPVMTYEWHNDAVFKNLKDIKNPFTSRVIGNGITATQQDSICFETERLTLNAEKYKYWTVSVGRERESKGLLIVVIKLKKKKKL